MCLGQSRNSQVFTTLYSLFKILTKLTIFSLNNTNKLAVWYRINESCGPPDLWTLAKLCCCLGASLWWLMTSSVTEISLQVSGSGSSALLAGKHHCSAGTLHGSFLLQSTTIGGLGFISLFSSCLTGVDIIQPSGRIGCQLLFGPLYLRTTCHL